MRRAPGADEILGGRASFAVPAGDAIAPGSDAVTLVVEADHRPVHTLVLPPGALVANRAGQVFALRQGGSRPDCATIAYPADQTVVYTTGETEGHYLNGDPRVGTGEIRVTGENFTCGAWATEDGPGKLGGAFLMEADPQAGDTANVTLIDD